MHIMRESKNQSERDIRCAKKAVAICLALLASSCSTGRQPAGEQCEVGAGVSLGPAVNSSGFDGSPTVSADETELLFTSDRGGQQDIFGATRARKTDPWSPPVNAGPLVNDPHADDFSLRLSNDGLTLYFASVRRGGFGAADIYVTTRTSRQQPWGAAQNAGTVINTAAFEAFPTPNADETTLYFERSTTVGSDDADIWMTTRAKREERWREPARVDALNSSGPEFSPSISVDGRTMYFATGRRGRVEVWASTRRRGGDAWTPPRPLGDALNVPLSLTLGPFISRDQRSLYFMSARSTDANACTPLTCISRLDLYSAPVSCR
jgi:Tol biopolymer transport system component